MRVDVPGSAGLLLPAGVAHLDPAPAVFEAMLEGWTRQQQTRFLKPSTVGTRVALVRRFAVFSNQYPWQWAPAEVEAFISDLVSAPGISGRGAASSTVRGHELVLRMFLEYLTDPRYGWVEECVRRFGAGPVQLFHRWNTLTHASDYEGRPGRRPLTYDEVQALFDAADGRVEQIRSRGRKGSVSALRDSALLKTVYAFGLRRQEAWGLDLADLRRNPKVPDYGRVGGVFVRHGKSSRGGPPKRRTVLTVPETDWVVPVLENWLDEVRPVLCPGEHPAVWVTERSGRLSMRRINEAFDAARQLAGLPAELDLHSLRHSYVTHLVEFDYPERFVQDQVGHAYASTTAIYTSVSDDYRNQLLRRSLDRRRGLWEQP